MKEFGATDRSLLLSMPASPIDAGRKGEPRNRILRRRPVSPSLGKLPSSLSDGLDGGKRRNTRQDRPEGVKESSWGVAIRPVSVGESVDRYERRETAIHTQEDGLDDDYDDDTKTVENRKTPRLIARSDHIEEAATRPPKPIGRRRHIASCWTILKTTPAARGVTMHTAGDQRRQATAK